MLETIAKCYSSVNSNLRISLRSKLLSNEPMDARQIRRANLIALIGEGIQAELGDKWEVKPSILSNIVTDQRGMGPKIARRIEEKEGLPEGWMDVLHPSDELEHVDLPMSVMDGIPVVGSVRGGPDGYYAELEHAAGQGEGFIRYPTRDPNTYALRVKGDSMRPRIRPGEFIVVSPNSSPIVGDEAVVKTRDGRVMVKLYAAPRNGTIELHSINHDHKPITIETRDIEYIHHVLIIAKADTYYPSMGL